MFQHSGIVEFKVYIAWELETLGICQGVCMLCNVGGL